MRLVTENERDYNMSPQRDLWRSEKKELKMDGYAKMFYACVQPWGI